MLRWSWCRVALAVVAAALVVSACAASTPSRSELVDSLRTAGVPAAEARCSVDAVFDTLTDSQIRDLYQRGNGGTPKDDPNDTKDAANRLTAAMGKCRDAATTTSVGSGPAEGASTTTTPATTATSTDGGSTTSGPAFTATDGSSASTTVPTGSNGLSEDTTTTTTSTS